MCKVCEVVYGASIAKSGGSRGAWSHFAVKFNDNPGKKLKRHGDSKAHKEAEVMLKSVRIEDALQKADQKTKDDKSEANELYIEKLIRTIHFLARNNLAVKELYPKAISFLSNEIQEPIIKQYQDSCPKNAAYDSSDSCDSLLNSLNDQLKGETIKVLKDASDLAIFADEATSAARKEMMGLFLSAYDEGTNKVVVEFVQITSVSSTQSAILMDKVRDIMTENGLDIEKTRFSCLDGTNSMSGEHTGLQRRIRHFAPFAIYVNCRCHRLALCFKHLFELFPWLESLDKLLLGLWKGFFYSGKNRHILNALQEAYGLKALNLVKAAVTRWLSHGSACRRCRERYVVIIEALDDIVSSKNNAELLVHRDTMLESQTVFQITFLEDVLSVTNALSLLLQSDHKDFAAISRSVDNTIAKLKGIGKSYDSIHLKSFRESDKIIGKIKEYERRNIVSTGTRKRSKIDRSLNNSQDFHTKVIQPFVKALVKEIKNAFDLTNLPILNAFLKLDPQDIPTKEATEFPSYGEKELKVLFDHYGTSKEDTFQERTIKANSLLDCSFSVLTVEYTNFKDYVADQKIALSEEYAGKEKSLQSRFLLVDAQKYKTRKQLKAIEDELKVVRSKKACPLTVEDLLRDTVIETAFPHVRRLLKIYVLIPMSEAIVERGFSKMGQIMTKKRTTLDDNSLDTLMRISYHKEPLTSVEIKNTIDIWKNKCDRRIFSPNF